MCGLPVALLCTPYDQPSRLSCRQASAVSIRVISASGVIGPDLTHIASRKTLGAGALPNTRGNLAGWIVDPQAFKPGNKMPPIILAPDDLQALLAYLESLK